MRADWIVELDRATTAVVAAVGRVQYMRQVTPLNLAAARARFLAAYPAVGASDPVFEYAEPPADPTDALREAADLLPAGPPWRALLEDQIEIARQAYQALCSRSPAETTAYALRQYGTPDETVLSAALRDLAVVQSPADTEHGGATWPAEQARAVLAAVLDRAGLATWSVQVREHMVARMSVLSSQRRVSVRADAVFGTSELRRLIVHEVGTHVFRSANAERQPLGLLAVGPPGYLSTEEGLAAWHERAAGLLSPEVRRRYALRYLACHAGLEHGFRAVVDRLIEHTDVAEAFEITARVKRGLIDTSAPGGFIKDQVYFGGLMETGNCLNQHPDAYDLLMASKWPVRHIPLLRELRADRLLLPPAYRVEQAVELAHELTAERTATPHEC
ncbi:tyrosine/phenylalanine carboxypeptidase domain-containing protein [Micromonospora sp. DT233]|uniref:tyrosine/phenylalanine carboxypeptidase domain-containing protein n=1 Tax=Micromonospora sp. DT233 TaxID=3393432 RepID=UPI003CF06CAB